MLELFIFFAGMCAGGAIVWLWKRPIQKAKELAEKEVARLKEKL